MPVSLHKASNSVSSYFFIFAMGVSVNCSGTDKAGMWSMVSRGRLRRDDKARLRKESTTLVDRRESREEEELQRRNEPGRYFDATR